MNRLAETNVWKPHLDYAGEPMIVGEFRDPPIDLYDRLAAVSHYERLARKARSEARKAKLRKIVSAFCIAAAVFAVVYFGGRELIGLVQ